MRLALGLTAALAAVLVIADAKSDLQKRYDGLVAAVKKKDLKTCMSFVTADYVDVDVKGKKLKRAEFEQQIKAQFAQPVTVEAFTISVDKATAKGADVVAETTSKLTLSFMNPQTNKKSKVEQISTGRDVWTKSGGKWLLKQSTALKEKRTLDGKAFGN